MRSKTQTKGNHLYRNILIVVLLSLVLIGGVVYIFRPAHTDPTKNFSPKYPETSTNDQDVTQNTKDAVSHEDPRTSDNIPVTQAGSISITDLEQKNGFINAKAEVSSFSTLNCVYSFTSDYARPVVKQQSGTCRGISIPEVEFEKIGTYTLIVTAYSATAKISATQEISVQ